METRPPVILSIQPGTSVSWLGNLISRTTRHLPSEAREN